LILSCKYSCVSPGVKIGFTQNILQSLHEQRILRYYSTEKAIG